MDRADWDERYRGEGLLWSAEPNRFLVQETAGLPPGRALDLACGEGRNAIWLAERGWQVTAVDFSAVGLHKGRQVSSGKAVQVTWVLADLLEHQPDVGAYDLVIVLYLQLPADDRRVVLRRAATALAQGGTLLAVGHDSTNLTAGVGGPQDPRVLFTADDVVADVGVVPDLVVEKATVVRRPVGTDGNHGEALDALARLQRM